MELDQLIQPADTKIVLVVMDGLGGYADAEHGTELEEADTPNLDRLAAEGVSGVVEPRVPVISDSSVTTPSASSSAAAR
jgi:2,3-bisphosphoglycerate-independent phosphoglycerate mutase